MPKKLAVVSDVERALVELLREDRRFSVAVRTTGPMEERIGDAEIAVTRTVNRITRAVLSAVPRLRVIAQGTSAELKEQLGATVLSLSFSTVDAASRAVEIIRPLSPKSPVVEGTVVDLPVEGGPATAAEALRRLDAAGLAPTGLTLREPSLDDVFVSLTGHRVEDDTPVRPGRNS